MAQSRRRQSVGKRNSAKTGCAEIRRRGGVRSPEANSALPDERGSRAVGGARWNYREVSSFGAAVQAQVPWTDGQATLVPAEGERNPKPHR
jgi:hypothetical protein